MAILIAALELKVAAMNAVIVVPMLAPKMNGAASFNFTTFFATSGTTNEVVTVLDLMAAVVSNPHPKDFSVLLKKNRWNLSCEPKPRILVITFRKNKIELKSNAIARSAKRKPLLIRLLRK